MTKIHEKAKVGFSKRVDSYERGRPSYPQSLIDFITQQFALNNEKTVLDLGAGTGKFSKLVAKTGAHVIAVEPVQAMRARLAADLPAIQVFDGTAESIPLASNSVDVVTIAQAFHWFNGRLALQEIHRVLRPGGILAMVWNIRDESHEWVAHLTQIILAHHHDEPSYRSGEWRKAFERQDYFAPLTKREFCHEHIGDKNMVIDRVASISYISALPQDKYQAVIRQVEDFLNSDPKLKAQETYNFPYRTDLYWTTKTLR